MEETHLLNENSNVWLCEGKIGKYYAVRHCFSIFGKKQTLYPCSQCKKDVILYYDDICFVKKDSDQSFEDPDGGIYLGWNNVICSSCAMEPSGHYDSLLTSQ
jgi:hypothetical protein